VTAFNYEMVEGLFFHADPHPANIVVRPGNTLVFIDFGSCGQITKKARHLWLETQRCIAERDVQGLVKCTISYMEPLPPIDLDRFIKEVEALYWNWMYAINSQHSEWWEKASGQLWMKFAGIAQRYNIPMNLDSLRMFRATFLYDTVMLRLWKHLDYTWEYQRYYRQAGDRARRRVRRAIRKRLKRGLTSSDYMQLEEMWRMGNQLMARVQHALDLPQFSFSSMVGKMAFGVSTVLKLFAAGCGLYLLALMALSGQRLITGQEMDVMEALHALSRSRWIQPVLLLAALIMVRKVLVRLQDVETNK
jgi:predicted unusual protein kinase regulating ubiquinone biosynthesis (AarF/ABC1/UbiB family)